MSDKLLKNKPFIGFIGLGKMGQPMALNLLRGKVPLIIWNRSPQACEPLAKAGALIAQNIEEVFEKAEYIIMMLFNNSVLDQVLYRGTAQFTALLKDHTLISTGTNLPDYSIALGQDCEKAGGTYLEAPVSGSRKPAEDAKLVGLLAGPEIQKAVIKPLLQLMCSKVIDCGTWGQALKMKLAINHALTIMLVGWAEALNFARAEGLSLPLFQETLEGGPMDCAYLRQKFPKMIEKDYHTEASCLDTLHLTQLILEESGKKNFHTPLIQAVAGLYTRACDSGKAELDMTSVVEVFGTQAGFEPATFRL